MPDDEVLVALITTVGLIIAAWIKGRYDARQTNRKLEDVLAQVQNSHGTNLRDDIDHLTSAVGLTRAEVRDVRTDLAGVHIDITDIRASDRAARTEHAQLWAAINTKGGPDA